MNAKWITISECPNETALYIFKRTFMHQGSADSFKIEISADSRYRLYINGRELSEGPCQSGEYVTHFETLDAADALIDGENVIEVRVLHAVGDQFLGVWRKEKPALFFYGLIDGDHEISSDTSFTCERVVSHKFYNCREIMHSVAPFEHMLGDAATVPLETVVLYTPSYDTGFISPYGTTDRYKLEPRPIPLLLPMDKTPISCVREYTAEDGKYNLILDAGRYTTAMVSFEFCAERDRQMRIYYAECMLIRDENGKLVKGTRDDKDGDVVSTAYDTVTASGNKQLFEPFWYRAFRFIRIECDKKPEYIKAYQARYVYSFEAYATSGGIGHFSADDSAFSDMWRVSVNTLECSSHETFTDCPFYEQQQYAMDGGLESLYAWRLSNDSSLQRQIIASMAHSQESNGMIHASYPSHYRQIIPGFPLYYVMLMREYLRHTGDTSFVGKYIGVCERVLEAFECMLDSHGLVMPPSGWCFVDWVDTWTAGVPNGGGTAPITVYSMLYAVALEYQAQVCEVCGRTGLAGEYRTRREAVINSINKHCYDRVKGMYVDVIGRREFSTHTTVWAVLSGCTVGDEARELVERTMSYTDVSQCSFSMNFYLLRTLEKTGLYEKYVDRILVGWRKMLSLGCTTWCESLALPRSECHGWSSVPVYEMSAMILGVYPTDDGFKRIRIKPTPLGLSHARGRVPTPWGYVDVSWKRHDGLFELNVTASREATLELMLPSGKTALICGTSASLCDK